MPDLEALRAGLARAAARSSAACGGRSSASATASSARARALERGARRALERDASASRSLRDRLRRGPALLVERRRAALERAGGRLAALSPRATLCRGYAIVRASDGVLRSAAGLAAGARVEVELAEGGFGARVEDVRP